MKPKIITMYLPQYYETEENSRWWGKGYTEWTAVRAAEKYSDLQYQPKVPFRQNYYNLLDKGTMLQQAKWMKEYNVYGQCFYHYWFKDGKKVLEKPAENLLVWKEIDIPFCFSWANESWTRTWSNVENRNTWADKFEHLSEQEGENNGMLLEQSYGTEKDWKKHFQYLLPFFQDDRYIRIESKPLFLFYKPEGIPCLEQMINCWNKLAYENGLTGIYFVGTNSTQKKYFDAVFLQEPQNAMRRIPMENIDDLCAYEYDALWEQIVRYTPVTDEKIIFGGVSNFDSTPRRGKAGIVFVHNTPEKFQKYLRKLLTKSIQHNNEIVFINAWNEWGEGMYLEPDEKNGFAYLEAVRDAQQFDYEQNVKLDVPEDNEMQAKNADFLINKYKGYWLVLDRWLMLKEQGKSIGSYLQKCGINTVGIYGIGMLGRHLISELMDSDVSIVFGIDRQAEVLHLPFPICQPNMKYPEVDAIIVTVVYEYEQIKMLIEKENNAKVMSLEQIVYEI